MSVRELFGKKTMVEIDPGRYIRSSKANFKLINLGLGKKIV
jgi:hypothetical protein